MKNIEQKARDWLDGEILATTSCIERLAGIKNSAVNEKAQSIQLDRMRKQVAIFTYLRSLL